MMESIELKLIYVINWLVVFVFIGSCQGVIKDSRKDAMLECILANFIVEENSDNHTGSFLVGQHDKWDKNKSLIIVSYIPYSKVNLIQAEEKSRFRGKDVYYYQTNIGENNILIKVPNKLKWEILKNEHSENDIEPFFDPVTVQVVYNHLTLCWDELIGGEIHMQKDWKSKCKICKKD